MNSGVVVQWDDCATSSRVVVVSDMFFSLMFSSLASPSSLDVMGWHVAMYKSPADGHCPSTAHPRRRRMGEMVGGTVGRRMRGRERERRASPSGHQD